MYSQIASNKRKSIILIILFFVFVLAIGYFIGEIYNSDPYSGLTIALVISTGMALFSYYAGDKVALSTSGAKPLAHNENEYVYHIVENLCIASGMPMPKIYIINDDAPNAFACGRDPQHSSIALTTGLIKTLANEELEGVVAHELSHIKNYDIRIMTLVIVLVGVISLLADGFLRFRLFGKKGDSGGKDGGDIRAILMIIGIILVILSPIIARLIQFAISRKREFLADADGALLTRYPEGLAKALEKISAYKQPMINAHTATAHLYIANPFGNPSTMLGVKKFAGFFSTHPPIEERIKILRAML